MTQLLEGRDVAANGPSESAERSAARALYASVADPEGNYTSRAAIEAIRSEVISTDADGASLAALEQLAATWSAEEGKRHLGLLGDEAPEDLLVGRAALGCAPLALVSGSWLQWQSAPGNAHEETALALLALYASDVGVGHPRASRGSIYLELLRQLRVADYASPAAHLVHDYRVPDFAFYLPAVLLAMSRRPEEFRPELLGADLCLRTVGLLPALALVQGAGVHADWAALDPATERRDGEAPGGIAQCRAAIESLRREGVKDTEERLEAGFRWAHRALAEWSDALRRELTAVLDPAHEMAELLKLRAREGAVYHQDFRLAGRTLSSWLAESRTDPRPLMHALATSKLVRPGRSEASALVTGLVSERGPMFRVFAPEDLAVIRRWIDALPAADEPATSASNGSARGRLDVPATALAVESADGGEEAPRSLREAYHRLQTRATSPVLRRWAASYVHGWLARARHGLAADETQLPERWTPEGLRPWLLDQHDRHAQGFEEDMKTPLPSREALIESTVQLAPLTLIDGSWLQGFTDYERASSELGRFLFETYWDELGNGQPRINHPRIYRELLDQMQIDLPPTRSREFAESPLLEDVSFELPVYWLGVGRFPTTFMPEILGLNVAMELSGVGGSYRRARIALKHHGFSTRFVDIHNTIDNVATGHSAWAADAVDTYIANVGHSQGHEAQAQVWDRVRVGFVSLSPPSGFLARRAQRRAQKEAFARASNT